jgi:hypothetical protein
MEDQLFILVTLGRQQQPEILSNRVGFCFFGAIQRLNIPVLSKGLHNFTHPRTDAVAIMIAIDETGDKVLLGRGVSQSRLLMKFPDFAL